MNLTRPNRPLLAWMLYFSVLLSALACSIGHGQMAGMQLSGLDGSYCGGALGGALNGDLTGSGVPTANPATGFACSLCSSFVGLALAAFFGLLGLLPMRQPRLSPRPGRVGLPVRYLWPSANPRASPLLA
nr:DUF2946 domain-containing protein [uncultured Pseudomonas sp.]